MSASMLSVRARLTSAICSVISTIHNSRNVHSAASQRGQRNLKVEELEERILFGFFSLNPPWEELPPTTPTATCQDPTVGATGSSPNGISPDDGPSVPGMNGGGTSPSSGKAGGAGPAGGGHISTTTPTGSAGHSAGSYESSQPVVGMTGLPDVSATDVSSDAMGFIFAHSRTWTGLDNGSFNGNGWSNSELPYLVVGGGTDGASSPGGMIGTGVMPGTEDDSRISVVYGGTAAYTFFNSSGPSLTPFTDYGVTLQYISPPTAIFELTDAAGNVTEFYDVHRDTSGTPDPFSLASALPQTYGRFKSWTSANGTTSVVASYDSNGYVTNLVRSDSVTGESEQMVYSYATVTNDLVTKPAARRRRFCPA